MKRIVFALCLLASSAFHAQSHRWVAVHAEASMVIYVDSASAVHLGGGRHRVWAKNTYATGHAVAVSESDPRLIASWVQQVEVDCPNRTARRGPFYDYDAEGVVLFSGTVWETGYNAPVPDTVMEAIVLGVCNELFRN